MLVKRLLNSAKQAYFYFSSFFPSAAKDCVKISLQNLSKLADTLPAPDVSEAVNLILGFVKDSYPISSALFFEFENGEGYPVLLKVLLR